jgi:hypothetical protein
MYVEFDENTGRPVPNPGGITEMAYQYESARENRYWNTLTREIFKSNILVFLPCVDCV